MSKVCHQAFCDSFITNFISWLLIKVFVDMVQIPVSLDTIFYAVIHYTDKINCILLISVHISGYKWIQVFFFNKKKKSRSKSNAKKNYLARTHSSHSSSHQLLTITICQGRLRNQASWIRIIQILLSSHPRFRMYILIIPKPIITF
jgi:hypothetical protein